MTDSRPASCVVLGSPRSGTSMVAGIIADASYNVAADLLEPTEANPKGFFESRAVQRINEDLLGQHVPISLRRFGRLLTPRRMRRGQLWLARVEPGVRFQVSHALHRRMVDCVPPPPYAMKDPRFCFTLPAWLPALGEPACVVIFRHPAETVASIRREVRRAAYLTNLPVDTVWAAEVWERSYRNVVALETEVELRFCYVHYEQILRGSGLETLADFLGAGLTATFVDSRLHRSRKDVDLGGLESRLESLYRFLCDRADFAA